MRAITTSSGRDATADIARERRTVGMYRDLYSGSCLDSAVAEKATKLIPFTVPEGWSTAFTRRSILHKRDYIFLLVS